MSLQSYFEFWRQNIDHPAYPLWLTIPSCLKFMKMDSRVAFIEKSVIRANSGRLREFHMESDFLDADFLATESISFPTLQTLRLRFEYLKNLPASLPSGMPSLRTCMLYISSEVDGISHIHFPWAQLTNLSIASGGYSFSQEGLTTRCVQQIFECCPNLQKLALHLQILNEDPPSANPVRHTCLRYLQFVDRSSRSVKRESTRTLLDFLMVPSLLQLDLRSEGRQSIGTVELALWIRRSGCRLTSLKLWPNFEPKDGDGELDPDVDVLFAALPSLLQFEAPLTAFGDNTMQKVIERDLLPAIVQLTIAALSIGSLDNIMKMIEERRKNSRSSRFDTVKCSRVEELNVCTLTIEESEMDLYKTRGRDSGCIVGFPSRDYWKPDSVWTYQGIN
ncbi:hypothetical protein C0995_002257 [Termitomyces sp. Mi166|nr:hypothetical protein C0995_002257 [Termitomyces sp. Mi166\